MAVQSLPRTHCSLGPDEAAACPAKRRSIPRSWWAGAANRAPSTGTANPWLGAPKSSVTPLSPQVARRLKSVQRGGMAVAAAVPVGSEEMNRVMLKSFLRQRARLAAFWLGWLLARAVLRLSGTLASSVTAGAQRRLWPGRACTDVWFRSAEMSGLTDWQDWPFGGRREFSVGSHEDTAHLHRSRPPHLESHHESLFRRL